MSSDVVGAARGYSRRTAAGPLSAALLSTSLHATEHRSGAPAAELRGSAAVRALSAQIARDREEVARLSQLVERSTELTAQMMRIFDGAHERLNELEENVLPHQRRVLELMADEARLEDRVRAVRVVLDKAQVHVFLEHVLNSPNTPPSQLASSFDELMRVEAFFLEHADYAMSDGVLARIHAMKTEAEFRMFNAFVDALSRSHLIYDVPVDVHAPELAERRAKLLHLDVLESPNAARIVEALEALGPRLQKLRNSNFAAEYVRRRAALMLAATQRVLLVDAHSRSWMSAVVQTGTRAGAATTQLISAGVGMAAGDAGGRVDTATKGGVAAALMSPTSSAMAAAVRTGKRSRVLEAVKVAAAAAGGGGGPSMHCAATFVMKRYERGRHPFLFALQMLLVLLRAEERLALGTLADPQAAYAALAAVVRSSVEALLEISGAVLQDLRSVDYTASFFPLLDIWGQVDALLPGYTALLKRVDVLQHDAFATAFAQYSAAVRSFVREYEESVHGSRGLPRNAAVDPVNAATVLTLRRLIEYRETLQSFLGGTTALPASAAPPASEAGKSPTVFGEWSVRVLRALGSALAEKADGVKDVAHSTMFMINNFQHLGDAAAAPELAGIAIVDGVCRRSRRLVKEETERYLGLWTPVVQLLDVSADDASAATKARLKARFRQLNERLQCRLDEGRALLLYDPELRHAVRARIKKTVGGAYKTFLLRYPTERFTKNPAKYLKYPLESFYLAVDGIFAAV